MITHCGRVVYLVEAHQIRNYLLIDVRFPITLNKLHQDVNSAPCLIAENLASRDVVSRHNIGWLVLLHFSKLGTSFLKVSIENVHERSIEANKHFDHRRFFVNTILIRHFPQDTIQEVIDFIFRKILRLSVVLV